MAGRPLPVLQPSDFHSGPGHESPGLALGEDDRSALAACLRDPASELRLARHDRMLYATDASLYQVEPTGVLVPGSVDDAARALARCFDRGIAVLPRGGGTSLAGQATARALVVDFSAHCRALLSVDPRARRCTVEPGIAIDELNDKLAQHRLFFAPDPATTRQCAIGGAIGNNAAGARSIRFGRTSENLASVRALLADGSAVLLGPGAAARDPRVRDLTLRIIRIVQDHEQLIRQRFPRTLRRNAGYALDMILHQLDAAGPRADADALLRAVDLSKLVCGSEGTLAVTLKAELILHPLPVARGLAVLGFASVDQAIDAVLPILSTKPTAVELLDDVVIGVAQANLEYRRYVQLLPSLDGQPPAAALYVEYSADRDPAELVHSFELLRRAVPHAPLHTHTNASDMLQAWKLRKAGEPLLHGIAGPRKPITFVEDNAVPVERLGEWVRRFRAICDRHGTRAAYWAHASVGVLHIRPLIDLRNPDDEKRMHAIAVEAADLAKELGGVMSGEHGDGKVRGPLLERFFGRELMQAFRQVKHAFDPRNLLNPGNIVDPGPIESITTQTRLRPDQSPHAPLVQPLADVRTYFDFSDQHGFAGAAEQCNGAGVCRKRSGGTMCPSFMATLDERHSTRGRANALRLAITGQLTGDHAQAFNDPQTKATLDLCLSCKACKAECPSNVDVARLKSEYLAQGFARSGRTDLRSLVLAHVRVLNRIGSFTPRLASRVARSALGRSVINHVMGLHPKRSLPPFARPLHRSFAPRDILTQRTNPAARARATLDASGTAPPVLLFADCFTTFSEPSIGIDAKRLLEAFGYQVLLADVGCCGRPAISCGVLDVATSQAARTIQALRRAIESADALAHTQCPVPVLFLEPSCHSAAIDDWLSLNLEAAKPARQALAARSMLVEHFLEARWDLHPRRPRFLPPDRPVLLHGHCHQRALLGVQSSSRMLARVLGPALTVADTGCCGMAGSFGFARHRYGLSMDIARLSLIPAIDAAPSNACVCAPGTSCRHQVLDAANRHALHPVQVLAQLLAPAGPAPTNATNDQQRPGQQN